MPPQKTAEPVRGTDREKNLPLDVYFSHVYYSMPTLCSFAHQLHHIWRMKPASVVEVGIGNGFVSSYLRKSGVEVTTIDINPNLEPDIVAPLSEARTHLPAKGDLVVCCEVLEHMPLEELDDNLSHLRSLGDRLFLTLPNYRSTFGVTALLRLPKLRARSLGLNIDIRRERPMEPAHFWEVGYSRACARTAIIAKLRQHYGTVTSGRFELNPYHLWFECQ